jgi:glyoxylase-like metal-dependent hydrolase (beta-lactamase superfamily II)
MSKRWLVRGLCVAVVALAAWLGGTGYGGKKPSGAWVEAAPDVLRTPGWPAGYALIDGDAALLIDAPGTSAGLQAHGVKVVDAVLLTHHHRDTCAAVPWFLARGVKVRAPKASAEWLKPEAVRRYWKESLPLRNSRTAYLVVPEGWAGVDCSLEDGQAIRWRSWSVRVLATPGHSRDHVAYAAQKGKNGPLLLCCGDALASPGKLWSPYTTDWDHWTDAGLTPAARSLRRLAALKPDALLPAHGPVIRRAAAAALNRTAAAVEEVAFLKSFERYTKERLGKAPAYRFLAKEQAKSNGSLPWSKVSEHLYLTGNTYVLVSRDNASLVVDPWYPHSTPQLAKLRKDHRLGPIEVVMFSHAHYDHYDGIYDLPGRDRIKVWTLDRVAEVVGDPLRLRAPFVDARPVKIDRRFKDGDTATWREYTFRFHFLPGQSEFTMGVETHLPKLNKVFFTADNWFHQDQFSGSGGWMGLNRSFPPLYAASARKVLDAAPDWVLAEHGGAFEFNAEDFRRRVRWGQVSATAADAVCVSGRHRRDWDPHRIHVEPLVQKAKPGATLQALLVASYPLPRRVKIAATLEGRRLTKDQTWELEVAGRSEARRKINVRLGNSIPAGRHVFALQVREGDTLDACDAFMAVDVAP